MDNKSVCTDKLQLMQHCIGYAQKRVKRGKYVAYRNYCTTNRPDNSWKKLCEYGYAHGEHFSNYPLAMIYKVTREGMDFMQEILGVEILEDTQ